MKYIVDKSTFDKLSDEDKKLIESNCEQMEIDPEEDDHEENAGDMSDEEKNKIKDFDTAHDKGLAIIIGMGKPKKAMKE